MKKCLIMTLAIFLMQFAQASAQEVYAYSETRGGKTTHHYVVTNSVQETDYGIKVQMHTTGSGYNKYWEVGFTAKGEDLYIIWLPSTATTLILRGNNIIKPDYFKIIQALQ